jgi:subtilisin family serine protease
VAQGALLPYRIWRYFQYDQPFASDPQPMDEDAPVGEAPIRRPPEESGPRRELSPDFARDLNEWAHAMAREPFALQIGLDRAPAMKTPNGAPLVAVIDTGVDYNHPVIRESLWRNPAPTRDAEGAVDAYGWDFISGDPRPFDDGYHGTQAASLVLAVAPGARILPLKAFNPWGITSSAALYQSFVYAADHGARIILCPWATRQASKAIELGVAYARSKGALVVTAAGDRGDRLSEVAAYPAALSAGYDNLIAVAAVDYNDRLVAVSGRFSSYDATRVAIAAPALGLRVAEPRVHFKRDTSTGLAAALVAGALAREWAAGSPGESALSWKARVLGQARAVPGLQGKVEGARRLWIARSAWSQASVRARDC